MYKIYINDTPLFLADLEEPLPVAGRGGEDLQVIYRGKVRFLSNYVDLLEKTNRYQSVQIRSEDYGKLVADFFGLYKQIEAAGGLVQNPNGEILMIYRLETWDLPKGKIDPGESPPEAALREVMEETGLQSLELGPFLMHSWHTYTDQKGRRVLKCTHWYRMRSPHAELTPQTEEYIEQAVWRNPQEFLQNPGKVYPSILELLKNA
jgi:8-oxo-dGTP pyrophosphatase MutT (NUDIX family)